MHLFLLRHGQTDANAQGILQGHQPTSLNATGRAQAGRLAARMLEVDPPVEVLVTSDLKRAVETATPIAQALGLEMVMDAAWRERGFGELEGQTLGTLEIWRTASGTIDPPGGESSAVFRGRVLAALSSVVERFSTRRSVAVVTHGGVIRSVLRLVGVGPSPSTDRDEPPVVDPIANASILHLTIDETGVWSAVAANDARHLEGLITVADAV